MLRTSMCCKNASKRFFVLLLNSQKMEGITIVPRSLEVFKLRPDNNKMIEWANRLNLKELSELQIVEITIPVSRLI
jgi:hypothetical protein